MEGLIAVDMHLFAMPYELTAFKCCQIN